MKERAKMAEGKADKPKQTRTVKPVYAIMSIEGQPGLTKEDVKIHSVMKSAEDVLEALEGGNLPVGTFYKRIALS
jgi:hypothetical protein